MNIHSIFLTAISFLLSINGNHSIQNEVNLSLKKDAKMIVVLDAGHGGHDQGCSGSHSIEKELALKMTLAYGKKITQNFNDVEVVYTRTKDVFVALNERATIANNASADLFISIHCNAINNSTVNGSETYVMGLHKSEENLSVAKRENQSILLEKDFVKTYDGYDPNSAAGHIMLSMFQNSYLQESVEFANMIETQFDQNSRIKSRGVKQAGFVVLKMTTMPSVLVETGFLSHSADQAFLQSDEGQAIIVDAMFAAFAEYKNKWEARRAEGLNIKPGISVPLADRTRPTASSQVNHNVSTSPSNVEPNSAEALPNSTKGIGSKNKEPIFKVQIAATKNEIALGSEIWKGLSELSVTKEGDLFKYFVGNYSSTTAADKMKNELNAKGYPGAFLVAYLGNEKIKLSLARKMTSE